MTRYIALLRGINISGKNKVAMPELKVHMENVGFNDVRTYLNSGNVVFSYENQDNADKDSLMDQATISKQLSEMIQHLINDKFQLSISVYITTQARIQNLLDGAPKWWGNEDKNVYDNMIFVLPPATCEQIYSEVGEPKGGMEQICLSEQKDGEQGAIYWSFDLKTYQKTNWWPKTASAGIGEKLTIRTANTIRKIAKM